MKIAVIGEKKTDRKFFSQSDLQVEIFDAQKGF